MINDLIKKCQERHRIENCKDCLLQKHSNQFNEFSCLRELLGEYNEKYCEDFSIIDRTKFDEGIKLLYEC